MNRQRQLIELQRQLQMMQPEPAQQRNRHAVPAQIDYYEYPPMEIPPPHYPPPAPMYPPSPYMQAPRYEPPMGQSKALLASGAFAYFFLSILVAGLSPEISLCLFFGGIAVLIFKAVRN